MDILTLVLTPLTLVVVLLAIGKYRYENGYRQLFKIFGMGISEGWQRTDEGLAVYNEELFGVLTHSILRKYAGRVVAVYYSMKNSFYETFKILRLTNKEFWIINDVEKIKYKSD